MPSETELRFKVIKTSDALSRVIEVEIGGKN